MWKHFSRGLKGALTTVYKCNVVPNTVITQDSKQICKNRNFLPVLVEHLNRFYSQSNKCGCRETDPGKGKRKWDYKADRSSPLDGVDLAFLEALGWSSVLILGWYICQPFCCRKLWTRNIERQRAIQALKRHENYKYANLTSALSHIIFSKPFTSFNYILPQVKATKSQNIKSEEHDDLDKDLVLGIKNIETAHKEVMGQLDNWLGTECMQLGKHKEAASHFRDAAKLNNSSAMFNLGICYELGFGTTQNFRKAAELYKRASELGHATAMYNLGVFYVHGWGGVEVDVDQAHELFTASANLGQKDAQKALAMESNSYSSNLQKNNLNDFQNNVELRKDYINNSNGDFSSKTRTSSEGYSEAESLSSGEPTYVLESEENYHFKIEPKSTDKTDTLLQVLGISLLNVQTVDPVKKTKKLSVDSGVLDLTPDGDFEY